MYRQKSQKQQLKPWKTHQVLTLNHSVGIPGPNLEALYLNVQDYGTLHQYPPSSPRQWQAPLPAHCQLLSKLESLINI